jgi:cytochrome c oxidase assembly protein subunit 11
MTDRQSAPGLPGQGRANRRLAFALLLLTAGMIGLSFAAVPLYRIFCQTTGYGGTTQRADGPADKVLDRVMSVRFDANVASELDWTFQPAQKRIELKIGENALAFYKAVNRSDKPLTGSATFNVTPEIAGSYFVKIDCFCFTEQTLKAGQRADMPVSFYIDPAIMDDPDARQLTEITLSYTFFRVDKTEDAARMRPAGPAGGAATRLFEKADRSG